MFGAYVISMSGNELSMLLNLCRLETAHIFFFSVCLNIIPSLVHRPRILLRVSKSCQEEFEFWG